MTEAQKAYAQAVRIIRALSALPPSQVTPYHADTPTKPPAILKTLFPNEHGLVAKTIRAAYQLRHQQWPKFPAWLSRRFGGRTGKRREETRGRALKVVDLLEHAIELGHEDAVYTMAEISLVSAGPSSSAVSVLNRLLAEAVSSPRAASERLSRSQSLLPTRRPDG